MKEVCAPALLADPAPQHPRWRLAELGPVGRDFLFHGVGGEGGQHGAAAGQDAEERAKRGAAQHGTDDPLEVGLGEHQAADVFDHHAAGMLVLQVAQDLAQAEDAHAERHEVQSVSHFRHVEGEALGAGFDVAADQTQQQAQHDHGEGLEQRAAGQCHGSDQPQHHQRIPRTELKRHIRQRRGRDGEQDGRHRASEEGAESGGGERRAGAALFAIW